METTIYNQKGEAQGKLSLPEHIFGLPWNADLVHQVVVSMQSSARNMIAHTKTRGEVRGGGKKPWKQKGTGQARHGSRRSPIWVGGGVTHGPRNDKNYDRKVNKKMKAKALYTILSKKFKNGEVSFVDDIKLADAKTKSAVSVLSSLKKVPGLDTALLRRKNGVYMLTPELGIDTWKSFRNLGHIAIEETRTINPVSLMNMKHVVFIAPEESLRFLSSKLGEKSEVKPRVSKKAPVAKKSPAKKKAKVTA